MDWMLDPPEDDEPEFGCLDYDADEAIDEESANASSRWQNSRNF